MSEAPPPSESAELARLLKLSDSELASEFLNYAVLYNSEHHERPWRRERARRLLEARPEIASANVFTAAATGNLTALKEILSKDPSQVHFKDEVRRRPPLLHACGGRVSAPNSDPVACVRLLLEKGAHPNEHFIAFDQYRFTAITIAIGEGEQGPENIPPHPQAKEIVEALLDAGADPNDSQALYNTCFRDGNEWLELFLSRGLKQGMKCNWDETTSTSTIDFMLGRAVGNGHKDRVRLLLEHGADPDAIDFYNQRPTFVNALRAGHEEIAQMLQDAGAQSELKPEDHLRIALREGNAQRAKQIVEQDASLTKDVRTFVELAEGGNLAAVKILTELGADVHGQMPGGTTALHRSAISGHRDIVFFLLDRGARMNQVDDHYGGTVIGWASAGGHTKLREELLDRTTYPFDLAAYGRAKQLGALLHEQPKLLRETDRDGDTLLHCVGPATANPEQMIDLLLGRGADLNAKNKKGETPLARQANVEGERVAELLRARGAK